jgi:hypothetical protein
MRKMISSMELHFRKDRVSVERVLLREPSGDVTTIRLSSPRINVDLPKACFDLDQPAATETIRSAASGAEDE